MAESSVATESYIQARIRVNKEGMSEVLDGLYRQETFLLDAREAVPSPEGRKLTNRRLAALRRVIREAERTSVEHGWSQEDQHGEPLRSDA